MLLIKLKKLLLNLHLQIMRSGNDQKRVKDAVESQAKIEVDSLNNKQKMSSNLLKNKSRLEES